MDRTKASQAPGSTSERIGASRIIKNAVPILLYAFCGFLSSRSVLPFGAVPFGVALLCAANAESIYLFFGLCIGSLLGVQPTFSGIFIGIYAAALLSRILVRLTIDLPFDRSEGKKSLGELIEVLFYERRGYRVCISAIFAFALSLAFWIGGGFLYYDLFGLIISTIVAPAVTFLVSGAYCESKTKTQSLISLISFLTICAYGASEIKIYGVSLAIAGGMLATLYICKRYGVTVGILCALAVGLAHSPVLSPVFLLCALSFAVFSKISISLVCTTAFITSLFYAFYVQGIGALDGTVGGIAASSILFAMFAKLTKGERTEDSAITKKIRCAVLEEGELDSVRLFDMNRRMTAISEGLAALSELFEEIKLKFPRRAELREICLEAFEASCDGCAEYARCRSGEGLHKESARLSCFLEKCGRVESESFSDALLSRCSRLPDIKDEINYNFDIRFCGGEKARSDDQFSQDKIFGYKALSGLLEKSMESGEDEYLPDCSASRLLCEPLDALDIGIVGVIVYGTRRKRVFIKGEDKEKLYSATEQIADLVGERLGLMLDAASATVRRSGNKDGGTLELWEREKFYTLSVTRSSSANGERFCGDSLCLFDNSDKRFFAALSDGMGSGRDAALMSELTTGFVRNMLSVGAMNREILKMLNSFLQGRYASSAHECSATLDLMEFDTLSGKATFYKCGAAPTYVYRNGSLFKLRSRTMPLGILGETDARVLDFELDEGDVVVMMSDGVTGGKEECPYLFDLLRQNIDSAGASRTADLIMKYAKATGTDDDISLAVIQIRRKAG